MKNKDRFREKILEIACDGSCVAVVDGKPVPCRGTDCKDCDLHCKTHRTISKPCAERRKEWCEAEYIEPQVDWSKVAIDTPILVRNHKMDPWKKKHFAKHEDGEVYAWLDGGTSWTTKNATSYVYAMLAEEEHGNPTRLPCKVDDKIYAIIYDCEKEREVVKESRIIEVQQNVNGWFFKSLITVPAFRLHDFGKTVFLTRAEAEAKLKEMEG